MIDAFLGLNKSHHNKEDLKCKKCKAENKCDTNNEIKSCEICKKLFYGQTCLQNHKKMGCASNTHTIAKSVIKFLSQKR